MFSEFSSTSSSSLLSLDYPLNTDEPKILTCNQDSSHGAWTHMFDHLLLTGHASSCPGHRVCYACCLRPIPYSLNLLKTTHHSVWKSFTLRNFSDTSNALSCILLSTNTPYIALQDTPPSVYTYGWERSWMKEKIQFHASEEKLCILYNNYMSYEEKGGFDIDQKVSKTHKKMIHKQPNQASKQASRETKTPRPQELPIPEC